MSTANLFQGEKVLRNLNACVGDNGWTGMSTYIDGYQSATLIMLESIIKHCIGDDSSKLPNNAFYWGLDTSIYPIVFSARHFMELYVKQKIYQINRLKLKRDIKSELIKTHNIGKLWELLQNIVTMTNDSRINEYIRLLEPFIEDVNQIDSTGETFRYPYNSDNNKHLENISVIGVYNFYEKFNNLSRITTSLNNLMSYVIDEYRVQTYTKNMSRQDIKSLAEKLPTVDKWGKSSFDKIRQDLKDEFNISYKELSDVINIIKSHLEFKRYIYPNNYELQISEDKLIKLLNNQYSLEEVNKFTNEEIACLRTIIEISIPVIDGNYYSEDYQKLYEEYLKEYHVDKHNKESDTRFILGRVHRLEKGLEKINYQSLLS